MDPNLFVLDGGRVFEVLVAVVVMAFLIERALSVVFESRLFIRYAKDKGLKEILAVAAGVVVCWIWQFDALSIIFVKEKVTPFGLVVTGFIVAGGSKAAIKLFKDVMGFMSTAERERLDEKRIARAAGALKEETLKGDVLRGGERK
ncbi:MAG: hypothetical protein WBD28_00425 [Candidatus Zixiibacteriota bacterium]|jgi:hypothetical protein